MSDLRFCKDCVHGRPVIVAGRVTNCVRPVGQERLNLVTGNLDSPRLYAFAENERKPARWWHFRERCGPEAKFFEQRPPIVPPTTGSAVPPPPHKG